MQSALIKTLPVTGSVFHQSWESGVSRDLWPCHTCLNGSRVTHVEQTQPVRPRALEDVDVFQRDGSTVRVRTAVPKDWIDRDPAVPPGTVRGVAHLPVLICGQ